ESVSQSESNMKSAFCLLFLLVVSVLSDDVTLNGALKINEGSPRQQIPKSIGSEESGFETEAIKTAHRYLQKILRQERAKLGSE
ncbi:hypothetical protein PENTCL1PPCAC_17358, partial [Pristionchus entomophagus]